MVLRGIAVVLRFFGVEVEMHHVDIVRVSLGSFYRGSECLS